MGSAGGPCGEPRGICDPSCGTLSRSRCLWGRMAQDLSEKELLKMEVEQLKKEVKNPRMLVSPLFPSLLLFSIASGSSWSRDPPPQGEAIGSGVVRPLQPGGHSVLGLAPLGGKKSPPTPACPFLCLPSSLRPHPVQDLFSWTEQTTDPHRQTRPGTTLCSLADFQDRKGNQGLCGG